MAVAEGSSRQILCVEALCNFCLDYFKDPVITECGHNFCRACLAHYWERRVGVKPSCPQCGEEIQRNLIPNRQLANLVEISRNLQLEEGRSAEGKGGVCGKHQEPLKLFCKDDEAPLCVVCDKSKEHRDHQVVPLEEAAQDYKDLICRRLELLEEERMKVVAYKAETVEQSQVLLKQAKTSMEKAKEQIRELRSILNKEEKLLAAQLEEAEQEIAKKRDENLAQLSEELSSLGRLIQEMDKKRHLPLSELLQDVKSLLQSHKKQKTFHHSGAFPTELKSKIQDIHDRNTVFAEKMKKFRDTLAPGPQASTSAKVQVSVKNTTLQKANVTLDAKTAYPQLVLSKDRKRVRYGDRYKKLTDNPKRFKKNNYVLGCEGFTAGRHYWEVAVGSVGSWAVGVARKSIKRKSYVGFSPEKGIWAVGRQEGKYKAFSDPVQSILLPSSEPLRTIKVSLNHGGGEVAFHDADTGSHLYTFSGTSFSKKILFPFFYVCGKASLTIEP